jgi:hypothetical protein
MDTSHADKGNATRSPSTSEASSAGGTPRRGNPLRLGILLLVLTACIAALVYDYQVAKPGSEAAEAKIKQLVESRNVMAASAAGPVLSADVQKELGRAPTWVEEQPTYTVEWYCWWGKVPLLSTRRHYLTVLYVGEKRRFSSQQLNGPPAEDDLPTHFVIQPGAVQPLDTPIGMPPAGDGGAPKGKRKGKGKGGPEEPMPPSSEQESAQEPTGQPAAETPEKPAQEGDTPVEASNDKPAADQSPQQDKPAAEKPATETESDAKETPASKSDEP